MLDVLRKRAVRVLHSDSDAKNAQSWVKESEYPHRPQPQIVAWLAVSTVDKPAILGSLDKIGQARLTDAPHKPACALIENVGLVYEAATFLLNPCEDVSNLLGWVDARYLEEDANPLQNSPSTPKFQQ